MKRYLFAFFLLTHGVTAQTRDSIFTDTIPAISNFKRSIIIEFGLAPTVTRLPTIRSFFRANQIQPDPSLSLFFNFGFGFRLKRFKVLAQNGIGLKNARTYYELPTTGPESVAQSSIANYTSLWVGYDVLNSRNRRLFINAGLGGMEYGLNVLRRTNQAVPFGAILQTAQTGVISSLRLREVGYIDVNLEYARREKRRQSVGFTTRLGYRTSTYAKAYESDAYQLTGAPKERISQIYLQTVFSFSFNGDKWGFRWKRR